MKTFRHTLALVLSLPILGLMVAWDIVKLPVSIILILLVGFFDIIGVLREEKSMFLEVCPTILFLGINVWVLGMGVTLPKWMCPL